MTGLALLPDRWQACAMHGELAPGFLVAAPTLLDPNFRGSVVLLVEHRADGSLGFIVNRPAPLRLPGVVEELGMRGHELDPPDSPVLVGGPVAPHTGWILFDHHDFPRAADEIVQVSPHLAVSASRELLQLLVEGQGPRRQLLVLGYAGWGPGQLDAELAQGAWIPVDLAEDIIFETPFEQRWNKALATLGIDPARISMSSASEA
jgi:putative transcriptional regulator